MNQTSPKTILLIIVAIAVLAAMGVATLCLSLFLHTYADPAILTAIISITSGLTGALVTLLTNTGTKAEAGAGLTAEGSGVAGVHTFVVTPDANREIGAPGSVAGVQARAPIQPISAGGPPTQEHKGT